MGGGYYDRDVGSVSSSAEASYTYSEEANQKLVQSELHPDLDPKGRTVVCTNADPIVVAMDVTRSRGDDTKRLYDQLPTLMDRLEARGTLRLERVFAS